MAKPKNPTQTPGGDDRNLVPAGESDLSDLETRLAVFWERRKNLVLGGIAALLLAFLAVKLIELYADKVEAERRAGYAALEEREAKLAWARENAGHPLAGVAFKELADRAYAEGRFEKAAERYAQAAASADSAVTQAARLGQAMTLLELGRGDEAETILRSLAEDEAVGNRHEARYHLARLALKEGRFEEARQQIRALLQSPQVPAFWARQAAQLQRELPRETEAEEEAG